MDYSPAGLIGLSVAVAIGLIAYLAALPSLQNWMRSVVPRGTAEERDDVELKLGVTRRLVLTAVIVVCGWGGYWLGKTVAG